MSMFGGESQIFDWNNQDSLNSVYPGIQETDYPDQEHRELPFMAYPSQFPLEDIDFSTIRLEVSKSPIMEALVFCALAGWGIELLNSTASEDVTFRVWDFKQYYQMSALICSKQKPTEDETSRIKALKRWFPDFPSIRDRRKNDAPFIIHVRRSSFCDNKPKKLKRIIEKTKIQLAGISKKHKLRGVGK